MTAHPLELGYHDLATPFGMMAPVGTLRRIAVELNGIELKWCWEQPDPLRSGSSGDLAKLFRNEGVKEPGLLAMNAPNQISTVMAREVIQNSWDAGKELATNLAATGIEPPGFEIEFRFRRLVGAAKSAMVERLDLRGLADHVSTDNRTVLGLSEADSLDSIDDDNVPLRLLEVVERGATGMYGPFTRADSKLYLALISIGYTMKQEGAGGSFGYGKAGLIRGSVIRSLVAYTCFREQHDDPGVTRRLLGMTYWGQHNHRLKSYTGFARFGRPEGASALPFENDDADEVAESLGIDLRTSSDHRELGTTILLVDPAVDAAGICEAIERNWWPALIENEFVVTITTEGGETLVPRPRRNPILPAFVRSLELATTSQDNQVPWELRRDLGTTLAVSAPHNKVGMLGAVADLEGWSYPALEPQEGFDSVEHRSLIALVRGPRMVVEYLDLGQRTPHIRGVFVADAGLDDLLRQAEPKAHDAWQTNTSEEGIDPAAPKAAKSVLDKIKKEVRDFQTRMKPPPPKNEDVRLPLLQELFKRLLDGKAPAVPPGPEPAARDISIEVRHSVVAATDTSVVVTGSAMLRLTGRVQDDFLPVEMQIAYLFMENDRAGEACRLRVETPQGWQPTGVEGVFAGQLGHEPSNFRFESLPYAADWSGRIRVRAEVQEQRA